MPRAEPAMGSPSDIEAKGFPFPRPSWLWACLTVFIGPPSHHAAGHPRGQAVGGTPVVFTFDRHPSEVVAGRPPGFPG